eukprot:869469-Pelagomonas_calceolata.AAC.1
MTAYAHSLPKSTVFAFQCISRQVHYAVVPSQQVYYAASTALALLALRPADGFRRASSFSAAAVLRSVEAPRSRARAPSSEPAPTPNMRMSMEKGSALIQKSTWTVDAPSREERTNERKRSRKAQGKSCRCSAPFPGIGS